MVFAYFIYHIIFLFSWSIDCKMPENSKTTVSSSISFAQPTVQTHKNIQFKFILLIKKQTTLALEKLEPMNIWHNFLKEYEFITEIVAS